MLLGPGLKTPKLIQVFPMVLDQAISPEMAPSLEFDEV